MHVSSAGETLAFDHLVICAGLQSDLVAGLAGDDAAPAIVPFRGEYYTLIRSRTSLVNGLIELALVVGRKMALLVALRRELRPPSERFPYGHYRVIALCFLLTAMVLLAVSPSA